MAVPLSLVQQFRVFEGLPSPVLVRISQEADLILAKSGSIILAKGEQLQHMHCLISGRLELTEYTFSERSPNYSSLWPGDLIGITTLITDCPIAFSLRATADTHLMAIPLGYARKLGATQPQFIQNIQGLLVQLLERANAEKAVLSISNAYQRVFAQLYLLSQPQKLGSSSPNQLPKQQDLAQMVNTSRETVSRAIALLINAGIVTKSGHHIQVQDMTQLMALAHNGPDALK